MKKIEYVRSFNKHGLAVVASYGYYGIVNTKGEFVLQPEWDYIHQFSESLSVVKKGMLMGAIDTNMKLVIPLKYQGLRHCSCDRMAYMDNGLWGFIDSKGKVAIAAMYKDIGVFSEGLCAVKFPKKKNWGFIDPGGSMMIPAIFSRVMSFSNGWAAVYLKGTWQFVNKNNELMNL